MTEAVKNATSQWRLLFRQNKNKLVGEGEALDQHTDNFIAKLHSKLSNIDRVHSWDEKQKLKECETVVCKYLHALQKKNKKDSPENKNDICVAVSKVLRGVKTMRMALSAIKAINPEALVKKKKPKKKEEGLVKRSSRASAGKEEKKISSRSSKSSGKRVSAPKEEKKISSRSSGKRASAPKEEKKISSRSSGKRASAPKEEKKISSRSSAKRSSAAKEEKKISSRTSSRTSRSASKSAKVEEKKRSSRSKTSPSTSAKLAKLEKEKERKAKKRAVALAKLMENLQPNFVAARVDAKEGGRLAAPRVQYDPATGKKRAPLSDANVNSRKSTEDRVKVAKSREKKRAEEKDKKNQCNVIEFMKNIADPSKNQEPPYAKTKGLLVAHGMGSGKTLTSLWVAKEYIRKERVKFVNILAPNVAIGEFIDSFERAGITSEMAGRIRVITHTDFVQNTSGRRFGGSLVIVDEAHMFTGEKYDSLVKWDVPYILLLSGTPAPNFSEDIVPLINLLYVSKKNHWSDRKWKKEKSPAKIEFMKNKVSTYNIGQEYNYMRGRGELFEGKNSFPGYKVSTVSVKMSVKQNADYLKLLRSVRRESYEEKMKYPFFARERAIINTSKIGVTPKVARVAHDVFKEIKQTHAGAGKDSKRLQRGRILLYAFNIDVAVDLEGEIRRLCRGEKGMSPSIEVYNGDTSGSNRLDHKETFNEGDLDVLIISKAGSVGLDLQCTSKVFMYDMCWNIPQMNQIIGRAIRYKSHRKPCDHNHVGVYIYTSAFATEPPKGAKVFDEHILEDALKKWDVVAEMIEDVMLSASIGSAASCQKR